MNFDALRGYIESQHYGNEIVLKRERRPKYFSAYQLHAVIAQENRIGILKITSV